MTARSSRMDVRNPLTTLPAMAALLELPDESRVAIVGILNDLAADAAARAEKSWRTHKGPMAAYWQAVSVYAKHLRAAVRP